MDLFDSIFSVTSIKDYTCFIKNGLGNSSYSSFYFYSIGDLGDRGPQFYEEYT